MPGFSLLFPSARRRAPSGRSKVSLCQWKTSNSPGKKRCPGSLQPCIVRQPSSFSPAQTFFPHAAAIIWAPRQIPSTVASRAIAFLTSAFSGARNGYMLSSFDAHLAAKNNEPAGRIVRERIAFVEPEDPEGFVAGHQAFLDSTRRFVFPVLEDRDH